MMKRLPIFLGVFIIIAIVLVARFDKDYDAAGHGYDVKCTQPSDPSSTAAQLTCAITAIQKAYQSESKPPWWHKLMAWPEGITAWLLLFTLAAIYWQSSATAKSAKAAFLQIEMMKAKERAWIAVEILPLDSLEFGVNSNRAMLKFSNFGFTHAINARARGDARAIIFEETLLMKGMVRRRLVFGGKHVPLFDPLPFELEDLDIPTVIPPNGGSVETWAAFIFPDEWYDQILLRPKIRIEVEGSVEYEDVFGCHHLTEFSYQMWIPSFGEISPAGSSPIRPYSPLSRWVLTQRGNNTT